MDNGLITKCKEKECLLGKTEGGMMETTSRIRSKGMEYFHGQMGGSTKACGLMVYKMEKELTQHQREKLRVENGRKGRSLNDL